MYDDERAERLRSSQRPHINQHINNPCKIWQSLCGNWLGEVLRLPLVSLIYNKGLMSGEITRISIHLIGY